MSEVAIPLILELVRVDQFLGRETLMIRRALLAIACALAVLGIASTPALAGAEATPVTVHDAFTDLVIEDDVICGQTVDVTLDGKSVLHANTTNPANPFDESAWVQVTYTEVGTFEFVLNGVTYTGRYTVWFGGSAESAQAFTFTFSASGTGADGSRIAFHDVAQFTATPDGIPRVEFDKPRETCP